MEVIDKKKSSRLSLVNCSLLDNSIEQTPNADLSEFECDICTQIVDDPQLCKKCEAIFCLTCINKWLLKSDSCPNCIEKYEQHISRRFNTRLTETKIQCPFARNGCLERLNGKEFRAHESTCMFRNEEAVKINCSECEQEIFLHSKDDHIKKYCEAKMITCIHCDKTYHISNQSKHEFDVKCLRIQNQKLLTEQLLSLNTKHLKSMDIILVGDSAVGKTCLIKRFIEGNFYTTLKSTVGFEFVTKQIQVQDGSIISVRFWDTSGDEKFRATTTSYYKKKDGAILVYDTTLLKSFINLEYWLNEIENNAPPDIKKMILGSKIDMKELRQVNKQEACRYAMDQDINIFGEISSATGQNVIEAIEKLVQKIYDEKDFKQEQIIGLKLFRENGTITTKLRMRKCSC